MPLAVATESSHLSPSRFLSLFLPRPILIISFRQSALICVCPPPFLASLRRFIFSFGLFPHFLPPDLPANRPKTTIQSVADCKNKRIPAFSFLYAHVSASISEEGRVNAPRCNAQLPSISVLTKTGVCVFDPCWAMTLVDTRFVYLSCVRKI